MRKIPLTKGQYTVVDDTDYKFLNQWKWFASYTRAGFYAARQSRVSEGFIKRKLIFMHRVLCPGEHEHVDHRDCDTLNNRRNNLRGCTASQNHQNRPKNRGTSKYKGVHWVEDEQRWYAAIKIGEGRKHLGIFVNEIDAGRAYNEAAKEGFGEFANLNKL